MISFITVAICLYLTYYTFIYAKLTWQNGNKTAGAFILLLAACFPPLTVWEVLK
ncbi:hypothetical protein P5G65_16390 [Paenibacillus chondroitinus]|uniref:TMhelix containing protein n=1 Tax=Paenibacillus chondroitinus TaxID=59842 RepID=A0ABU6DEU9_9BACL|nr:MULTISPECIES: hypothetical protein [Paenibacillus]MCY9659899.1 hypothetical protein [Paenibacillus anseongense]MEB4795483.1 hypothetical protein [Paenibacillus chondroitinus]